MAAIRLRETRAILYLCIAQTRSLEFLRKVNGSAFIRDLTTQKAQNCRSSAASNFLALQCHDDRLQGLQNIDQLSSDCIYGLASSTGHIYSKL